MCYKKGLEKKIIEAKNMTLYLGVRVEIANRFFNAKEIKQYNRRNKNTKVLDIHSGGRITVEKTDHMLIARGEKNEKYDTGMVNFSVVGTMSSGAKEVKRVVQIINVLGNDRLIRERVYTFVEGRSVLGSIPELYALNQAFENLEKIMPGFVKAGWYYAPEAMFR